jgi:hypothetical protein
MLPSLLLTAAIAPAAPVPKDTVPNTTGPAPRVLAVKADAGGVVWVSGTVYEKRKVKQTITTIENGKPVTKQQEVEVNTPVPIRKPLGDFGGRFATADGTRLTAEEATRRVKDGATLLVTADNKPVDAGWLRAVRGDTVVMFAEGLARAHFQFGLAPLPTTPAPRLALFCADENGVVRVPVNTGGGAGGNQVMYQDFGNGQVVVRGRVVVQGNIEFDGGDLPAGGGGSATPAGPDGKKALDEIPFDAYDLTGKVVPRAEALKRLKAGGLVLLAGDSRFPDADYLKAFRDDILILMSSEFVFPANVPNPYDMPAGSADPAAKPDPNAKPVPVPAPALAPAAGVARPQILIKPAVIKN